MQISIGSLLVGAEQATGAVAIIDVFRAFTTAAVAFANGASHIIMVGSVDEALSLRTSGLAQVCMGEVGGRAPPGFARRLHSGQVQAHKASSAHGTQSISTQRHW
jgi:2-phosphosulfolactate phosphatase